MRSIFVASISVAGVVFAGPAGAIDCSAPEHAIGLERIVEVDASGGPLFGAISKQQKEPTFLREKEVVLTFDDGPSPWVTPRILDTLEHHCTRATFFSVGKMAVAYPVITRDIIARGHTLAGHTWAHPRQLPKMPAKRAQDEIERGFAALDAAAGGGIAPFFRFTGLNDSAPLLGYLQDRGVATFTVDVVTDDSFIADPAELTRVTLARVVKRGGGILLFHDIKPATAKALPAILEGLKERGFKVVHMRPSKAYVPRPEFVAGYRDKVAANLEKSPYKPRLMPFYGAISVLRQANAATPLNAQSDLPVAVVSPAPRDRRLLKRRTNKKKSSKRRAKPPAEQEVLPWKKKMALPGGEAPAASPEQSPAASTTSWRHIGPHPAERAAPYIQ